MILRYPRRSWARRDDQVEALIEESKELNLAASGQKHTKSARLNIQSLSGFDHFRLQTPQPGRERLLGWRPVSVRAFSEKSASQRRYGPRMTRDFLTQLLVLLWGS